MVAENIPLVEEQGTIMEGYEKKRPRQRLAPSAFFFSLNTLRVEPLPQPLIRAETLYKNQDISFREIKQSPETLILQAG